MVIRHHGDVSSPDGNPLSDAPMVFRDVISLELAQKSSDKESWRCCEDL